VCLKYPDGKRLVRQCAIISERTQTFLLEESSTCPDWVFAHENGAGYYRVLYDTQLQERLSAAALPHLTLIERVSLLDDVKALLTDAKIAPGTALTLAAALKDASEREIVISSLLITGAANHYVPFGSRSNYARFVTKTYGARARALGWDSKPGESEDVRLLRQALLLSVAGRGGDEELTGEARRRAVDWLNTRKAVDGDLLPPMLITAAMHGDREMAEQYRRVAETSSDAFQRGMLVFALSRFRDPTIGRETLQWMLDSKLDINESQYLLEFFRMEPETRELPWEFVAANYDKLVAKIPSRAGIDTGATLISAGKGLCDAAGREKVVQFFGNRAKNLAGGPRELASTLETIDQCIARRAALEQPLAEFLKSY
jgi:alanyl aminopeptidase